MESTNVQSIDCDFTISSWQASTNMWKYRWCDCSHGIFLILRRLAPTSSQTWSVLLSFISALIIFLTYLKCFAFCCCSHSPSLQGPSWSKLDLFICYIFFFSLSDLNIFSWNIKYWNQVFGSFQVFKIVSEKCKRKTLSSHQPLYSKYMRKTPHHMCCLYSNSLIDCTLLQIICKCFHFEKKKK